jgi:hypothetical protein
LSELAFFDVYPVDDAPQFSGAWSNFPFFPSGIVIVGGIEQGLFVLRPTIGGQTLPPSHNLLNQGPDKNTRVVLLVTNLQLVQGETASSVIVNLTGSNNEAYNLPAEDIRPVISSNFAQVVFRLPDALAPGTCTIKVKARGQESNPGTIRIKS